jgi:hypothetical protein
MITAKLLAVISCKKVDYNFFNEGGIVEIRKNVILKYLKNRQKIGSFSVLDTPHTILLS